MQPTITGDNRTGAAASPKGALAMAEAVLRYSPPMPIDTTGAEDDRALYVVDAEPVGSIPPPVSINATLKTGVGKLMGDRPELLMDKIGERIAFERGGVRLYDALIAKYNATAGSGAALPALADVLVAKDGDGSPVRTFPEEEPLQTLERIRSEELFHFRMLCGAMESLGGDPTAQTPCADVIGTASMGLMQVVTDPRTTLAQSFTAVLTAELTDNAGWELLIQLTKQEGEDEIAGKFVTAHAQEVQHLKAIRTWLSALVVTQKPSVLV